MKTVSLLFATLLFLATSSLSAGDEPTPFPQWDGKETIAEYAKRAELDPTLTLDLGGGIKWEGVLIPAGSFMMGTPPGEAKTKKEEAMENQHKVTLTRPFYMGKLELTQAQYHKVTGENPSGAKGDDLPVHNVSWQNAEDFCEKLARQCGQKVQLPTEAQWEYACRAGTTTAYYTGNTIADLDKAAWTAGNSGKKIHKGGEKLPNAWGLYDMLGNVREFVRDCYDETPKPDAIDPTGPNLENPKNHVVRGGAYTANAAIALNCRSASRRPTETIAVNGFRIIVAVPRRAGESEAELADTPVGMAKLVFMEDFESTPVGEIPTGFTKTGAVAVVDDVAHSGKKSLRMEAATNGPRRITTKGEFLKALGGKHWGRLYFKVKMPTPTPTGGGVIHSTLVAGSAQSPLAKDPIEVRVLDTVMGPQGTFQYIYNVQPRQRPEFGKGSPYNYHFTDEWTLAEWYVDSATQTYRLFINGAEIKEVSFSKGAGDFDKAEIPEVFESLSFGWNNYQKAGQGFVAWIDDIALSKERIGDRGMPKAAKKR